MKAHGAALKSRLATLEKQWEAGVLATHEALALCWESDIPRHEWPAWIEPAIGIFSSKRKQKPEPVQPSHPLTSPDRTRILATMADKLVSRWKASAPAAARAAVEAMREQGWPHGEKVVQRVKREMSKLVKDMDGRALRYNAEWDLRAMRKLTEQGKSRR